MSSIRAPILSLSWLRNEGDILEYWVRYHCAAIARMIIVLHRCEDVSAAILRRLQREGLPIEVHTDDQLMHRQGEVLTALLHEEADCQEQWILPLDGDEFLAPFSAIHDVIGTLPEDHVTLLPWRTYIPTPEDDARASNILGRIRHRRMRDDPPFSKVLIPRIMIRPRLRIPLGSHFVLDTDGHPIPTQKSSRLFLAHFPVRSEQQLRRKILRGWESHLANPRRSPGEIFQWEHLYERCRHPRPMDANELRHIALRYAIPLDQKYSMELACDPLTAPNLPFAP